MNNVDFCTVGISFEDGQTVLENDKDDLEERGLMFVIVDDLEDKGVKKYCEEVVDQWVNNVVERQKKIEEKYGIEEFNMDVELLKEQVQQFKDMIGQQEGYLIKWSVETDSNLAFFAKDNSDLMKAAEEQEYLLS